MGHRTRVHIDRVHIYRRATSIVGCEQACREHLQIAGVSGTV